MWGRIVLVTGASTGIGRATAEAFARKGDRVVITDVREDPGPAAEREMRAAGLDATFIRSDATDEAQVDALISGILDRFGRLDVAINNVGATPAPDSPTARLHETSLEAWRATTGLCLTSCFLGMRRQIPAMLAQGAGVIANTASLAGLRTSPKGSPTYHAAKAGLIALSRKAAVDYARDNIRVNVVAPGLTATDHMLSRWSPEALDEMASEHPTRRAVTPEQVAAAFVWLCSEAAGGVTGHVIPVDGGWAAR
jgi:NAD(P)-dependent dehydrogenase (short-subunit alcohol dehydrogenase family)